MKDMQLAGLFAAAIVLAAAARSIADAAAAGGSDDRRNRARPCRGIGRFRHERRVERSGQRAALRAAAPQPDCRLARDHAAAADGVPVGPRPQIARHRRRVCDRRDGVPARRHGGEDRAAAEPAGRGAALLAAARGRPDRGGAERRRGADCAADPAAAGRRSARAARRGYGQDLARPPLLYLGFRRQAHRRAPAARLGSRFGARDTGRQGADPAGPEAAAAAPAQRAVAGLARTRAARRRAVRAAARLAVAAARRGAWPPLYAAAAGGSLAASLRRPVGRLGGLAGMVAGDARPGGVRDHRDGARRC